MTTRKATIKDADLITECIFLAMEDILYEIYGKSDAIEAKSFLKHFVEAENNQYSYQNCWILENENGETVAATNLYEGAELHQLRTPILEYLKSNFKRELSIEDETEKGEIYIDCIGVLPQYQGKGYGTVLLNFLIEHYVKKHRQTLGLLVDLNNPNAKKLYLKMGFKVIGIKTLTGKKLEHLQISKL